MSAVARGRSSRQLVTQAPHLTSPNLLAAVDTRVQFETTARGRRIWRAEFPQLAKLFPYFFEASLSLYSPFPLFQ